LDTKVTPVVKSSKEILDKISDFFNSEDTKENFNRAYLISDFQKISTNFNKFENDSNLQVVLVPLEAENTNNLFVDSVWFETPYRPLSQTDVLNVKITNKSTEDYNEMPISLFLNDTLKATGSYNITANTSVTTTLNFTNNKTGIINGRVEITDFPITYDNTFFFNFDISEKNNILIISNKQRNKYIEDVFSNATEAKITYKTPKAIDYENIANYNVIISDEIENLSSEFIQNIFSYITDGGIYICFPNTKINIQSYNKLFNKLKLNYITGIDTSKTYAGRINYNAEIFRNVFKKKEQNLDMPYVLERVKFSNQTFTDENVILFSENNDKLISSANIGSGKAYIFSQSADKKVGNLVLHPIWAPMIYNMAFYKNNSRRIYYTLGKDEVITFNNTFANQEDAVHIVNDDKSFDIIPQSFMGEGAESKIFLNNEIKNAGHYSISFKNIKLKGLSFNYDRQESDLSHFSINEIENIIKENTLTNFSLMNQKDELFSQIIKEQSIGKQLWKWFIFFALLFLLIEILVIRYFK